MKVVRSSTRGYFERWILRVGPPIAAWLIGTFVGIPQVTLFGLILLWIVFLGGHRYHARSGPWAEWQGSKGLAKLLSAFLFFILSIALIVRHDEYRRDTIDLVLLGILWSTILLLTFAAPTSRGYRSALLLETMLVAFFSIWSVNLAYPVYNGRVDFLYHVMFSTSIVQTGHIPTEFTRYFRCFTF